MKTSLLLMFVVLPSLAWAQAPTGGEAPEIDRRNNVDWVHPGVTDRFPVVVIDSGVDYTHPDLAPLMHRNLQTDAIEIKGLRIQGDAFGFDFNEGDHRAFDQNYVGYTPQFQPIDMGQDNEHVLNRVGKLFKSVGKNVFEVVKSVMAVGSPGHGTHVSGLVAQECKGACSLVPIKVFGATTVSLEMLEAAVDYTRKRGYRLVNMSLGINGMFLKNAPEKEKQAFERVYELMKNSPDILFVIAAGNEKYHLQEKPVYPASFDLPNTIVVGAVDAAGNLAPFSNFDENQVDVFAPGVDILSTWNDGGHKAVSGTSMATPIVAGRLALLWSQNPSWSVDQLKEAFLSQIPQKELSFRDQVFRLRVLERESL